MNKKIKILLLVAIIVAFLPAVYKHFVVNNITQNVNSLSSKGFLVTPISNNNSYINTKVTYKLSISDPKKVYDKFLLNALNSPQNPMAKSIISSFDGSEFLVKLNILNFPVGHKNAVSIYFTNPSAKIQNSMQSNAFGKELLKFLANKGFGAIVDINAAGKPISISFKNIDKVFNESKNKKVVIKLKNYRINIKNFNLKKHAYTFDSKNDLFSFGIKDGANRGINLKSKNLHCRVNQTSLYDSSKSCAVDEISMKLTKFKQKNLLLDKVFVSMISKSDKQTISYRYNYKTKDISYGVKSNYLNNSVDVANFIYKGSVEGIDKSVINKFIKMRHNNNYAYNNQKAYLKPVAQLINAGFTFKIDTLGADSLKIKIAKKRIDLGKISMNATFKILKNNLKIQNILQGKRFVNYINLDSKITLREKDFNLLEKYGRQGQYKKFAQLAKHVGKNIEFHITFRNNHLVINGTKLM